MVPQNNYSEHLLDKKFTAGYAIRRIENGKITFDNFGGQRAIEHSQLTSENDLWHLGSCTKSMTAYLIGILIDEGRLNLSDTIGSKLGKSIKNELSKVKIIELLTHRSGITEVTNLKDSKVWPELFDKNQPTNRHRNNLASAILNEDLKFIPDSKFEYSNSNYVILGEIIEQMYKKSWEEVIQEKLFKPLEMNDCGFGPAAALDLIPPNQPWGHQFINGKLISIQPKLIETAPSDNPLALGPAGSAHCGINSWSKFLIEMLHASNGKSKILKPNTALKLFSKYKDDMTVAGWGSYYKDWAGGNIFTMVGSNTMNYAMYIIAPEKKLVLLGATNSGADQSLVDLTKQLKALVPK